MSPNPDGPDGDTPAGDEPDEPVGDFDEPGQSDEGGDSDVEQS